MMAFFTATRAMIYLQSNATFEHRSAHTLITMAFKEAGVENVSVYRGIMSFDPASGVLRARPWSLRQNLPAVVEAVGSRDRIESALPRVRQVLDRGLITLAEVDLHAPD